MNRDEKSEQDIQELKGHVEQTVGRVFGDGDLVAHGMADQLAAHTRRTAARARDAAGLVGHNVRALVMRKLGELHQQLHEAAEDAARESEKDKAEEGRR